MMPPLTVGAFDASSFWNTVAAGASAVAMWAQSKVIKADPVADLTDRLRNPRRRLLTAIRHPVRTWRNL